MNVADNFKNWYLRSGKKKNGAQEAIKKDLYLRTIARQASIGVQEFTNLTALGICIFPKVTVIMNFFKLCWDLTCGQLNIDHCKTTTNLFTLENKCP